MRLPTCLACLVIVVGAISPAAADTFLVNSTVDAVDANPGDGICQTATPFECTLRAAIIEANATPGQDTVDVPAGEYLLTLTGVPEDAGVSGDLDVTGDLVITGEPHDHNQGFNSPRTIIDGADHDDWILTLLPSATLEATDITVQNGGRGGIAVGFSELTLINSTVQNNSGPNGAGIHALASTVTIRESTISGNHAIRTGNHGGMGGGIINGVSQMFLTNVTISGNTADRHGGGIANQGAGSALVLLNTTIAKNNSPIAAGLYNGESVTTTNTILSDNDGENCAGPTAVTSGGHNIDSDGTCELQTTGDLQVDPDLDPLFFSGGPTRTHRPQFDGPAVHAGDIEACPSTDQRGAPRPWPLHKGCDIGAVEIIYEGEWCS